MYNIFLLSALSLGKTLVTYKPREIHKLIVVSICSFSSFARQGRVGLSNDKR